MIGEAIERVRYPYTLPMYPMLLGKFYLLWTLTNGCLLMNSILRLPLCSLNSLNSFLRLDNENYFCCLLSLFISSVSSFLYVSLACLFCMVRLFASWLLLLTVWCSKTLKFFEQFWVYQTLTTVTFCIGIQSLDNKTFLLFKSILLLIWQRQEYAERLSKRKFSNISILMDSKGTPETQSLSRREYHSQF